MCMYIYMGGGYIFVPLGGSSWYFAQRTMHLDGADAYIPYPQLGLTALVVTCAATGQDPLSVMDQALGGLLLKA